MTTPTGILGVTTSGIQDVSGFLPLLGTEQCEEHVSAALDRGFFYAAGAPMSIFGSLGIVKAGFIAFWISLDISPWFHGPRQLRNAGFYPKGSVMGKLAYALDRADSIYVAEAQMRPILHRYLNQPLDVAINLLSWPWLRWNILMFAFGIGFGSLGLLPYVYIIQLDFRSRPISESWLYPVLRVYGCVVTATMIQLIVQLRILSIVNSQIRVHVLRSWFQEQGRVPPVFWNIDIRSEECLLRFADDIAHSTMASQPAANGEYLCDLEASVVARPQFTSFQTDVIEWGTKNTFRWLPLSLLGICRILLVGGIAATGIGYIGCFSLIQDANTSIKGPGIWLAVEIILCIIRLIVWASNPGFDDPPPPIVIHQYQGVNQTKVAYNIGWMLNDDAMLGDLHAVVIGIDQVPSSSIPKLKCAINDARSVVTYLHDDLAVPEHQITSLLGESATSGAIEAALERLATYNDIPQGAPIVLFMACPIVYASVRPRGALTFVTFEYDGDQPGTGLAYTKLLGLLQTIAVSKGNNITVILDTCFDGIGRYQMFDPAAVFSIGYSSHVLLAASSGFHERETEEGGVFTRVLLKQLRMHTDVHSTRVFTQVRDTLLKCYRRGSHKAPTSRQDIRTLTYPDLINIIRADPEMRRIIPVSSGSFQNRLLFNGLMARKQLGREMSKNTGVILISHSPREIDEMNNDV